MQVYFFYWQIFHYFTTRIRLCGGEIVKYLYLAHAW